ncbi:hypothetical protein MPSEU_000134000 [Mayamaea pseudoterrestris]|nr:hypothetical protein MPSEU_000134000 [Mayamaea pseudoterrestris]
MFVSDRPYLIYGASSKNERTAELVHLAIKCGFRYIDTACFPKKYNEPGVGEGWIAAARNLTLTRSELFLQKKFTSSCYHDPDNRPYSDSGSLADKVRKSLEVSLRNLQTDYVDSLLMHAPEKTLEETMVVWRTMESLVDENKVRNIGVSNLYDVEFFKAFYEKARIKPWAVQNRFYAKTNFDTDLRAFLKSEDIIYQPFWILSANKDALTTEIAEVMANAKGLTPQTLMYACLVQLGYATPLDGTTNLEHMLEDVAVMQRLQKGERFFTEEEMHEFAKLLGMPHVESF